MNYTFRVTQSANGIGLGIKYINQDGHRMLSINFLIWEFMFLFNFFKE